MISWAVSGGVTVMEAGAGSWWLGRAGIIDIEAGGKGGFEPEVADGCGLEGKGLLFDG